MKKRILLCMLVCMLFALLTTALATEGCEHKNYEKVSVVREGNCKLNQTRVLKVNCKDCTETEILLDLGLPHNYQDDYVEPTCTKPGKAGKHCNLCDKWVDSVQILDALGHDWENGNVPFTNCEVPSGPHRVCKRNGCGEDEWLAGSVGVKDHTFAKTETSIEPTCEDTGTYYYACTVEGCSGVKEDPKPALGHNVVEDIIPATCVAKGYTTHRCDRNGCTYKEDATDYTDGFDSTNHTDKGYRVFLAATCTVPGAKREVCSACKTELGPAVRIDPLGHNFDYENGTVSVPPTCTKMGKTTYTCTRCTEPKTEEDIDATGHLNTKDVYIAPTCEEKGLAGKRCACGEWVDSVQILDALGHDWENGNVPFTNCEVPSGPHRVCKRNGCGEDEWLAGSVGVKDHTFAKTETSIEPTCEDTGTYYYACTVEGCSGVKEDPKPALGHNVVEDIIPATCVAKGYTTHRCDRNGCTYKEDATDYTDGFDSTNHIDKGYRVFLAATCTVPGAKREVCSACDTELGSAVRIDPLGHSKPDAKTTYLTDDKGMYYTCTNFRNGKDGELCGEKQYVDACKLGFHVYIKVEAKEATCVEGGWKEFKYCKVCETEEAIKNENLLPIDPENHDKEIIDAKAATCLDDGNEAGWRCKREGCTAGEGGATITATGHQWGEWVVVTKPTYDKDGERTRTCNVCSKTEEEGIPKLNEYDVNGDGKVTLADVKKLFNSGASLADVKKAFNIAWESAE